MTEMDGTRWLDPDEGGKAIDDFVAAFIRDCVNIHRISLSAETQLEDILSLKVGSVSPARLLIAPAGSGKTTSVIRHLSQCRGMVVYYFVPSHKLATDLLTAFEKHAASHVEVRVYQGRNEKNCDRHELVQKVAKRGLPVQDTLCHREEQFCPFYESCAFQKSKAEIRAFLTSEEDKLKVCILAHACLRFSPFPDIEPDIVIVDEQHWQQLCDFRVLGEKSCSILANRSPVIFQAVEPLLSAIKKPKNLREIRALGFAHPEKLDDLIKQVESELRSKAKAICPSRPNDAISSELRSAKCYVLNTVCLLLKSLKREVTANRDTLNSVTASSDDKICIHYIHRVFISAATPVLHIDATADQELCEKAWGRRFDCYKISIQRNARIIQIKGSAKDRQFSKRSIVGSKQDNGQRIPTPTENELRQFIPTFTPEPLIIAPKEVRLLFDEQLNQSNWAHYGNLRGLDHFKDYSVAIIISREQPPFKAMNRHLRALYADDSKSILSSLTSYSGDKVNGEHLDSRGQRILKQFREHEVEQAIDRLRLIYTTKPKLVIVLNSLLLDCVVGFRLRWNDLLKIRLMIDRCFAKDYAIPLSKSEWVRLFPDLWSSKDTVKSFMQSLGDKRVKSLILYMYPFHPFTHVSYRLKGQSGSELEALVHESASNKKATLEKVVGDVEKIGLPPVDIAWLGDIEIDM